MTTTNEFISALKNRRSIYVLGRNVDITEDELVNLIEEVVKESPTAFNAQTQRAIILFGENHEKVWDIAEESLKPVTPPDAFPNTQAKIKGFRNAFATVLFFEDQDVVSALQEQFPLYADNFPHWSEQAHGIALANVWTALATKGLGANVQHYNPLIDAEVAKTWHAPKNWKLRAQLVIGSKEAEAGSKEYMNDADRFKVFR